MLILIFSIALKGTVKAINCNDWHKGFNVSAQREPKAIRWSRLLCDFSSTQNHLGAN